MNGSLDKTGSMRTKQNTIKYDSDEEEMVVENGVDVNDEADISNEETTLIHNVIVTNASMDISGGAGVGDGPKQNHLGELTEENNTSLDTCSEAHGLVSPARSACVSPASSNGGVYTVVCLNY